MPNRKVKTKATALPYKGAPLGVKDLIVQQVNFEDNFLSHAEITFTDEQMRKELPSTKWKPAAQYAFHKQIFFKAMGFILP